MLYSDLMKICKTRKSSAGVEVVIPEKLFKKLIYNLIYDIEIDEAFYLEKYPDVKNAIQEGQVLSAKEHFLTQGYFENRIPYQIKVDENFYLNSYPDIKKSYETGKIKSLQDHFLYNGIFEGRLPYEKFSFFSSGS